MCPRLEILTLAQRTMGLPRTRVQEMLDLVSLTSHEADWRVRDYSLGMRQRLGIGAALLGDPHVLILDEPANGLGPAGIRWMRDLLRGLADHGGTVLLSSHLLHDVEVIADDLVVIGNGRIVAQGTKSDLLAAHVVLTELRAAEGAGLEEMFAAAIGAPMTVILPMIAILAVTGEWSQGSGLTTFTLVPHRCRVLRAKFLAATSVGVVSMFVALVVGVLGTLVGSAVPARTLTAPTGP